MRGAEVPEPGRASHRSKAKASVNSLSHCATRGRFPISFLDLEAYCFRALSHRGQIGRRKRQPENRDSTGPPQVTCSWTDQP